MSNTIKIPKPPKLEVMKYNSAKHAQDFARMALYFNKLWTWSFPQKGKVQVIPLSRLNRMLTRRRNEPLVKMAANIWFEQETRGNSVNKQCSKWTRRPHPRINKQALQALRDMESDNVEVIDEVWTVAAEKNDVEVHVKTTVRFASTEAALAFQTNIAALLAEAA